MAGKVEESTETGSTTTLPQPSEPSPHVDVPRFRVVRGVVAVLLGILVAGLAFRQLGHADDFTARERKQNYRRIIIPAARGVIYDREHRVLADTRTRIAAAVNLGDLRNEFTREEQILQNEKRIDAGGGSAHAQLNLPARARLNVVQRHVDRLSAVVGRGELVDATRLERALARERTTPFVLIDHLTPEECDRLSATLHPIDTVRLLRIAERSYPHGRTASHVLGWVRRERATSPDDDSGLSTLNTFVLSGVSGVEKQHDATLRGQAGTAIIRLDAFGYQVGDPLETRDPVPGTDVVLSLDLDLQRAAEQAMAATPGEPRGAAVALSVATGEVLALVSKPDFDLSELFPTLSTETKQRIEANGAWLNRATQGLYPPGSTFKIFTALAGLRGRTLQPSDVVVCRGSFLVGSHTFPCHRAEGHGPLSLRDALAHSCNIFAYETSLAAGADALSAEARRFHFHEPTGIDLPSETRQMLVPDPLWKKAEQGEGWTAGDTVNFAIGQGFLRVSPLQAACAIASFARGETLTVPTLLHAPERRPSGDRKPEKLELATNEHAALVEALRAVVATGIGRDAQVPGITLAGKTGTAQVLRPEGMMNVAWFVAFAPVERPEIAVAVALEGNQPGVEFAGGEFAAPVVREIIGTYFDKRTQR